jgi:uncharacterized coiled-coil protein SlyX
MAEDDRLTKLEMLTAHQERQIQDLSDMIHLQRQEIDILKRRFDRTQEKMLEIAEHGASTSEDPPLSVTEQALRDKPPHY